LLLLLAPFFAVPSAAQAQTVASTSPTTNQTLSPTSPISMSAIVSAPGNPGPAPTRAQMTQNDALFSSVLSSTILARSVLPVHGRPDAAWRGGIMLDDSFRHAVALPNASARSIAAGLSDGLLLTLAAFPVLVDAMLTTWLVNGDQQRAQRMLLVDLQMHAFAQGITTILKLAVRRERPIARGCREDPQRANDPSCQEGVDIQPESFFSGHTSLAFTSAALMCFHRATSPIFGEAADAATCVSGMALASTVGLLRIMSDRHYLSDVVVGAGIGLFSGLVLPYLFSFDVFSAATGGRPGSITAAIAPMIDEDRIGVQLFGGFL
jgi:membrane-associated phospholipid phosphatase